jgi:hypothetical protein
MEMVDLTLYVSLRAVSWPDVPVAFPANGGVTDHLFQRILDGHTGVTLQPQQITVPVVRSLHELAISDISDRRREYMCFARQGNLVLIWNQSADELKVQQLRLRRSWLHR